MNFDSEPVPSCARRTAVRALAGSVALLVAGRPRAQADAFMSRAPACVLTPEQTEGPYFVDERLERADIRSDPANGSIRQGAPLALALRLSELAGSRCTPLRDAIVDVWHCDAAGVYSDADDARLPAKGSKFLRGYQATDERGQVRFTTIYPGAYRGRAVHIHFKVRAKSRDAQAAFTSQLYFDDALTDRVHADPPYAGALRRRTRNGDDGLFRMNGRALVLDVVQSGGGYVAVYDVGVRRA